jgi:DNA-binding NarL/FixJ family response regulator
MIDNDDGKITPNTNFDFLHFLQTGFFFHKMEEHLKLVASNVKARRSQIFRKLGTKGDMK